MTAYGVDYAFSPHPTVAELENAKISGHPVDFVIRYVGSNDYTASRSSKWLNPVETKVLHPKFALAVVFETSARRAEEGASAGIADAMKAVRELAYCGLPATMAVYFAVDYDTTVGPHITSYFKGVASTIGLRRTGAYGGYKVIKALFDNRLITYGWQTYAWSGGKWDDRAQLQQFSNGRTLGSGEVDYNRATASAYGQWPAGSPHNPGPTKVTVPSGDPVLKLNTSHHTLTRELQHALNFADFPHLVEDGQYGYQTEKTVTRLQTRAKIHQDGQYGPQSAKALKALVAAKGDK